MYWISIINHWGNIFTQIFLLCAFPSVSTHAEHSTHQEFSASNETEIKFFYSPVQSFVTKNDYL